MTKREARRIAQAVYAAGMVHGLIDLGESLDIDDAIKVSEVTREEGYRILRRLGINDHPPSEADEVVELVLEQRKSKA